MIDFVGSICGSWPVTVGSLCPHCGRDCSAPFAICPYKGKYSVGRSTPDSLACQKLLAGMADRGATAAVVECTSTGIQNGRCVLHAVRSRQRVRLQGVCKLEDLLPDPMRSRRVYRALDNGF